MGLTAALAAALVITGQPAEPIKPAPVRQSGGVAEAQTKPPEEQEDRDFIAQAHALIKDFEYVDDKHRQDIANDVAVGLKFSVEIDKELEASEREELIARITKIGNEVAAIANETAAEVSWGDQRLSPLPYEFKTVKGSDVNAFSIPGGIIYVYEGLADFSESDDELAGVLAHEVSHAAFRHVYELNRRAGSLDILQLPILLAVIFGGGAGGDVAAVGTAAQLANTALRSGWSVDAEQAADFGAIQYLTKSRYNPVGALTLMERLAFREAHQPSLDWGIYRTHPPSSDRATSLVKQMKEFAIPIRRSQVASSFRVTTKIGEDGLDLRFGDAKIYTFRGSNAILRSEEAVKRLNVFFDAEPEPFEVTMTGTTLRGKHRRLFEISEEDETESADIEALKEDAFKQLKSAIYNLQFKLWSVRRRKADRL
jgi:Zn-dependent protease with chaperone function